MFLHHECGKKSNHKALFKIAVCIFSEQKQFDMKILHLKYISNILSFKYKNKSNLNFWHTVYQSVAGRILSKVAFVVVLIPLWLNVKTFTSFGMRLEGGEFLWVAFTNGLNIF